METLLQMPFLGIGQGLATGQSKLGNSLEAETKPSEGSGEQEGAGLSFPSLLILQTLGTDVKGPLLEDAVAKNPEATTSSPQPGKMEGQPRLSSEIKPVPGSGSVNLTIETLPSVENAHSPNQVLPGQQNNLGIATGNLVNPALAPALAPALTPAQSGLFDMAGIQMKNMVDADPAKIDNPSAPKDPGQPATGTGTLIKLSLPTEIVKIPQPDMAVGKKISAQVVNSQLTQSSWTTTGGKPSVPGIEIQAAPPTVPLTEKPSVLSNAQGVESRPEIVLGNSTSETGRNISVMVNTVEAAPPGMTAPTGSKVEVTPPVMTAPTGSKVEAAPPVMTAPTGSKVEATLPENATQQKSNPEQTLPGGTTTHTADIDPALSSEASQLDKHAGSFAMESFSQPAGLGVQPPGSRVESVTIGSTTPTEASPSRSKNIQNQVAKHIATHASGTNGLQKMTLQLNPENLGKVEIQIQGSDDKLSVVITASGREAEQSLRDGVKELVGGIMERSGRWQQVDIRVEQKESDSRRQGRDSTERQDDQEKQGGHGHRGQREQERPEQAKSWAEFHQGV